MSRTAHLPRRTSLRPRILAGLFCLAASASSLAQDLGRELNTIIAKARVGNASVSVSVRDVDSGRELASYKPEQRMIPASNLKLFTSGAAVAVLGANYEFRTELRRHADRLVIKGAGDPAFADPLLLDEMGISLDTFMQRLVESITKVGMDRVSEIVVDDRVFDRVYVHPDWPREQLDKAYCAEVSGLNFHANVLRIFASPGARDNDLANISTEPHGGGIEIKRRARTARGQGRNTAIGAIREPGANVFSISGTVTAPLEVPAETTLHEPALVFARLLADRLLAVGVSNAGSPAAARLVAPDEDLGQPDAVLAVVRTPLSVVLERCNRDSENFYAESLLKLIGNVATGQPGSWSSGAGVVRMQLRDRVSPDAASSVFLSDGSGLSRANKISASMMTSWLGSFGRDRAAGPAFIASIPEAGVDGTMKRRFRDRSLANEVRGKSGYINGVRTLSGYVSDVQSGRRVAYAVLINDIPGNVPRAAAEAVHEDVVVMVDRWLERQVESTDRLGGGESRPARK